MLLPGQTGFASFSDGAQEDEFNATLKANDKPAVTVRNLVANAISDKVVPSTVLLELAAQTAGVTWNLAQAIEEGQGKEQTNSGMPLFAGLDEVTTHGRVLLADMPTVRVTVDDFTHKGSLTMASATVTDGERTLVNIRKLLFVQSA